MLLINVAWLLVWYADAQNQGCRVDLTIVLDRSGSITHNPKGGAPITDNFSKVITFVKDIVNNPRIHITQEETHVALVLFESNPALNVKLSSYSKPAIISALNSAKAWGGSNPYKALNMVSTQIYTKTASGNRPAVADVIIFIGDGDQNGGSQQFIDEANRLKSRGVVIITVGVGMYLREDILKAVASGNNHYFPIAKLSALTGSVMNIVLQACGQAVPFTSTAATTTTTKETTTTAQNIGGCVYDIAIIVDRSGSIIKETMENGQTKDNMDRWYKVAEFVRDLINNNIFTIAPTGTHMALVSFANDPRTEFKLDLYDKGQRNNLLNQLRNGRVNENVPAWGKSNPFAAFEHTKANIFDKTAPGNRPNVPDMIIYIGDGEQNIGGSLPNFLAVAKQLKNSGVKIISLGVGELLDETVLMEISTDPSYYFRVMDPNNLKSFIPLVSPVACGNRPPASELPPATTTIAPPTGDKCPADIVFLMDSSGSIEDRKKGNYNLLKKFLTDIIERIDIGRYLSRIGLIRFSNDAKSIFYLNSSYNKSIIMDFVKSTGYIGGTTNIADALELLYTEQFVQSRGDRNGIDNVAILITDGHSTVKKEMVKSNAQKAKNKGIKIFSIGITDKIMESELITISSGSPPLKGTNYFMTADFNTLSQVISKIFGSGGCIVPPRDITCREPADIYIVLDSSGSMNEVEFGMMRDFAKSVAESVGMGNPNTGLGLIAFSGSAEILMNITGYFENFQDQKNNFFKTLEGVRYTRGSTNFIGAIRKLNEAFSTKHGGRPDLNNIAVLFTDGEISPSQEKGLLDEVYKTKFNANVTFIVVGIGPARTINTYLLRTIASYPHEATFVHIPSFNDLKGDTNMKKEKFTHLKRLMCNDVDECDTNPCKCSAGCHDLYGTYYCECPEGCGGVNCENECHSAREVVFAVDSATGISREQFRSQLDLVRDTVMGMNIDNDGGRVGLLGFSDSPYVQFHLNKHADGLRSKLKIVNAISLHFAGGATNTHRAINHIHSEMFKPQNGDTQLLSNMGVLVSDGRTTDFKQTWNEALLARTKGIHLITVNIGDKAVPDELEGIANGPVNASIINVKDFSVLQDSAEHIINAICNAVNDCPPDYCLNDGVPIDEINHCECDCPDGYSGNRCERGCGAKKDIALLIDNSGSIGRDRLKQILDFAVALVREYQVGKNLARFAAISFNDIAKVDFNLAKYFLRQDVVTAIRQMAYGGGKTNIADALDKAYQNIFTSSTGDRSDAENHVIIFTDGKATVNKMNTLPNAIRLREMKRVTITVIGIGTDSDSLELRGLASEPVSEMMILLVSLTNTMNNAAIIKRTQQRIIGTTCNEVNECTPSACSYRGTCMDQLKMFSCQCNSNTNTPYFAGRNCSKTCGRIIDVTLLLDLSGSMDLVYDIVITFAKQVVAALPIDEDIVRVSVITYEDTPTVQFYLNKYARKKIDMLNAMSFVNENRGSTNTKDSINRMTNDVFTSSKGDRSGAKNIGVIVTDGGSMNNGQTINAANQARSKGIELYVVVFGKRPDMTEINGLTPPSQQIRIKSTKDVIFGVSKLLNMIAQCRDT